ncbi:hypothetical protein ACVILL_004543 [Bradyrhizobium sp. USDA 3364]
MIKPSSKNSDEVMYFRRYQRFLTNIRATSVE